MIAEDNRHPRVGQGICTAGAWREETLLHNRQAGSVLSRWIVARNVGDESLEQIGNLRRTQRSPGHQVALLKKCVHQAMARRLVRLCYRFHVASRGDGRSLVPIYIGTRRVVATFQ